MSTVTTVGYGDIYPHTAFGKVIAVVVMVVGVGFAPFSPPSLQTASFAPAKTRSGRIVS